MKLVFNTKGNEKVPAAGNEARTRLNGCLFRVGHLSDTATRRTHLDTYRTCHVACPNFFIIIIPGQDKDAPQTHEGRALDTRVSYPNTF